MSINSIDLGGDLGTLFIKTDGASPTSTGVPNGVDVDVMIWFDEGAEVSGGVTLVPAQDQSRHAGEYEAFGDAEMWVSGDVLKLLRTLPDDACYTALRELECVTAKVAAQS